LSRAERREKEKLHPFSQNAGTSGEKKKGKGRLLDRRVFKSKSFREKEGGAQHRIWGTLLLQEGLQPLSVKPAVYAGEERGKKRVWKASRRKGGEEECSRAI